MKKLLKLSLWNVVALYLCLGLVGFSAAAGKKPPPPQPSSNPAIAFVADGSIYVVDESGANRVPVLQSNRKIQYGDPSWSPSGNELVFGVRSTDTAVPTGIYTVAKILNVDGTWTGAWSSPIRIAQRVSSGFGRPAWRPIGDVIAYEEGDDIYLTPADGSTAPVNLTNSTDILTYFSWSPDGNAFAVMEWHTDISDIVIYQFNGAAVPPTRIKSLLRDPASPIAAACKVVAPLECLRIFGIAWSKLEPGLIATAIKTRVNQWNYDIWCMNVSDPMNTQNLTNSNNEAVKLTPTWSPDDNSLAFADRMTRGVMKVELNYVNGTGSCPVSNGSQQVLVSPSSNKETLESPNWRR